MPAGVAVEKRTFYWSAKKWECLLAMRVCNAEPDTLKKIHL